MSGSDPSEIRARVEDLYAFAPGERTLGTLVHSLPSKMWPALGRWHGDGAWGRYFDNPADGDDLQFQDWQVIDMAGAAEHDDLCEAALFYLLERLRLALENPDETARVKLMVVDEAWRYLQDPAVLSYLAEAAKTWRKKNAALLAQGPGLAQDTGAVLRIIEAEDQIVRIQAKTRHTTVIVLPASEDILDFVVGDSEYWHLTGAANLAFLKPIAEGVTTNVALITVRLILVFVAIWLATGGSSPAEIDSIGGEVTGPARNFAGQMAAQIEAESLRAETRRAAAERTLQAQQRQEAREVATGAIGGGQVTMDEALLLAGPSPETGRAYIQQEFELRERLRLEALERRSRSLRSSPVAQIYRQLDRARSPAEAGAEPGPVEAIRAEGAAALELQAPWDVPGCDGKPGR